MCGHELLEARPRAAAVARPDCRCLRRQPERRSPTPVAGDVAHPIEPGNSAIGSDAHAVDALAADEGDPPWPPAPGSEGRHRVVDNDDLARDAQLLDPALQQPHVAWVVGAGKGEHTDCRGTIHGRANLGGEPPEPFHALVETDRLVRDRRPADGRQQRAIVRDERDVGLRVSAVDREDYHGTVSTGVCPSSSMPT